MEATIPAEYDGIPILHRHTITAEQARLLAILGQPTTEELIVVAAVLKALRRPRNLTRLDSLANTLRVIPPGEEVNSRIIGERLGIKPSTAGKRLRRLANYGYLVRTKTGRGEAGGIGYSYKRV